MNTKLSTFFDVDIIDVSIRQDKADFDIEVKLLSSETVRFFVYPETEDFRLAWFGSSLKSGNSGKVLYLQSIAKIANKLNNKENLLSLIDILKSTYAKNRTRS